MKLFFNIKILSVALLFVFSISINSQNIEHKSLDYTPLGGLLKAEPSEFLSEVIEIPIQNPEPFIAIGLNAVLENGLSNSKFYIRTSIDGTNWGEWQLVESDNDAAQSKNKFLGTLSFFEKENRFMQFRTNVFASLMELKFSFISPGKTTSLQKEKNLEKVETINTTLSVERPAFVSRKEWNCPQNEHESSRSLTTVTHLIIHHSAGSTVSSDYAAVVRSYWDYHVNTHGWADIGYNWLVDPNGVLYKGRAWQSSTKENVIGAHNSGKNSNTAGICFIGNYVSSVPSDAGLNKIADMTAFLCDKYGIEPEGESYHAAIERTNNNITGHGQSGGGTSCPGTQLINRMQTIRELTTSKILDITAAPIVVTSYPSAEVDSAYLSKKISFEFTHPMNKTSVENSFSITPNAVGTFSWNEDGNIIYFEPTAPFSAKTNYRIEISPNAMSKWDVPISESIKLNFITKARDILSVVTYPKTGDTEIDLDVLIKLQYDGPLLVTTLSGNILLMDSENYSKYVVDSESASFIDYNVVTREFEDGLVEIRPKSELETNAVYYIVLNDVIATTDGYTQGVTKVISFTTKSPTSVGNSNAPDDFRLISAYPNPFNPSTTLQYRLKNSSHVSIKIYDIIGKEVVTLVDKNMSAGIYKLMFNASNLPSGVYFSQIITNSETKTIKLLLMK